MDLTQACLALVHSSSVFNELLCVMQWAGSGISAHTQFRAKPCAALLALLDSFHHIGRILIISALF